MTVRTVILSGTGRYGDPWHPFGETSARLAAILQGIGHEVTVRGDVDAAMASLAAVDLVVVNAGDPWRGGERGVDAAAVAAFDAALDRGVGVLALHSAVASLRDYPRWAGAIGAVWLPTLSFHPPFGRVAVDVEDGVPFTVEDERYCALQATGDREVVAWHEDDSGRREPTVWRRTAGRSRIAVDVLGHDARSYDAPGHVGLVADLATWAAAAR